MKTEKQLLLDELDSFMTKFDESWDDNHLRNIDRYYESIKRINSKLGIYTPRLLKLIDYSKLDNFERTCLANKF